MLESEYDMKDPSGKSRFIADVANRLLRFEDQIERDNYAGLVAYKYDLTKDAVSEAIRKQAISRDGIRISQRPLPTTKNDRSEITDATRLPQGKLLSWLCEEPKIFEVVSRYIRPDDFADSLYRKVAEELFRQLEEGSPNPAEIIGRFADEEEQRLIAEAFHQNVGAIESISMKESALKDLMLNIKRLSLTRDDREGNDFSDIIRIRKELEELQAATIDLKYIGSE